MVKITQISGGSGGTDPTPIVTAKIAEHAAANDPHGDRAAASSALAGHVAGNDPHGDRAAAASALSGHVASNDPHGDRAAAASALAGHVAGNDPHGDRAAAASALAGHVSATDPHGDRAAAASALAGHVAGNDPHGDRAAATAALESHTSATDPHPQYFNAARGDARYVQVGGSGAAVGLPVFKSQAEATASGLTEYGVMDLRSGIITWTVNTLSLADPPSRFTLGSITETTCVVTLQGFPADPFGGDVYSNVRYDLTLAMKGGSQSGINPLGATISVYPTGPIVADKLTATVTHGLFKLPYIWNYYGGYARAYVVNSAGVGPLRYIGAT